jgi:hypothetical protein
VQINVSSHDDVHARELKIAVPCWMLDDVACSSVVVQDTPQLHIESLLSLRQLVDQFASAASERQSEPHGNNAKGDRHAEANSATHLEAAAETKVTRL